MGIATPRCWPVVLSPMRRVASTLRCRILVPRHRCRVAGQLFGGRSAISRRRQSTDAKGRISIRAAHSTDAQPISELLAHRVTRLSHSVAIQIIALARLGLAQQPAEAAALLESVVPAARRAEHVPGAVVSVVSDGRVVFAKGYGLAQLDPPRAMTESTIVRIGSISKVMTAVAVAQLADRGRIRLDADVNQYLRDIKVPTRYQPPLTPWHLLTHTAALDEIRPGTQAEAKEKLESLRDFRRPRLVSYSPPGTATAYSTYASTLGGLLVEDVSGQASETYLVHNVWRPLGMMHTSIDIPEAHRQLVAIPYDVENGTP